VAYKIDFGNKGTVYPGYAGNTEVDAKYEPNIYIFLTSLTRVILTLNYFLETG